MMLASMRIHTSMSRLRARTRLFFEEKQKIVSGREYCESCEATKQYILITFRGFSYDKQN